MSNEINEVNVFSTPRDSNASELDEAVAVGFLGGLNTIHVSIGSEGSPIIKCTKSTKLEQPNREELIKRAKLEADYIRAVLKAYPLAEVEVNFSKSNPTMTISYYGHIWLSSIRVGDSTLTSIPDDVTIRYRNAYNIEGDLTHKVEREMDSYALSTLLKVVQTLSVQGITNKVAEDTYIPLIDKYFFDDTSDKLKKELAYDLINSARMRNLQFEGKSSDHKIVNALIDVMIKGEDDRDAVRSFQRLYAKVVTTKDFPSLLNALKELNDN